ncbi:MAG: flagellar basal body-associated protein FliL, partial [Patiriisocius sp.]
MKSLKSFIIIGLILMVVAIGSTTYIWFTIQKEIVAPAVPAQEASEAMVAQEEEEEKE